MILRRTLAAASLCTVTCPRTGADGTALECVPEGECELQDEATANAAVGPTMLMKQPKPSGKPKCELERQALQVQSA